MNCALATNNCVELCTVLFFVLVLVLSHSLLFYCVMNIETQCEKKAVHTKYCCMKKNYENASCSPGRKQSCYGSEVFTLDFHAEDHISCDCLRSIIIRSIQNQLVIKAY